MATTSAAAVPETKWPLNLQYTGIINLEEISVDFEDQKERLFQSIDEDAYEEDSPFEEMNVEGMCAGKGGKMEYLTDSTLLKEFLESSDDDPLRIILLNQSFSWGALDITPEGAQSLLVHLNVMPEFWNVLRAFGAKNSPVDESWGGIYLSDHGSEEGGEEGGNEVSELCYLLKHVEERSKPTVDNHDREIPAQWANRQMGVYHQQRRIRTPSSTPNQGEEYKHFDTFIIVNPAKAVRILLEKLLTESGNGKTEKRINAELVHTMIASTLTVKWKRHIGDIEAELLTQINKAYLTSNQKNDFTTFAFDFKDTQAVYDLRDKILKLDTLLDINDGIFDTIQSQFPTFGISGVGGEGGTKHKYGRGSIAIGSTMKSIRKENSMQKARLMVVLQRLEGCCAVIKNIMDLRLAAIQQDDNRIMTDLGKQSRRDAQTTKTLTVLALIFIPASFASQVLSMGYITFSGEDSQTSVVRFSGGLVAFLILTLLCIIITVAVWYFLKDRNSGGRDWPWGENGGENGEDGEPRGQGGRGKRGDELDDLERGRLERKFTGF